MGCFRSCLRLLVTMMALSFFVVPQVSMTKVELNTNLPITDSLIKLCPHRNFILVLECNVTETYFLQWSISHIEPITYTPDSSYMPIFENEDKYIFLLLKMTANSNNSTYLSQLQVKTLYLNGPLNVVCQGSGGTKKNLSLIIAGMSNYTSK